jgi:hypothetical protein
LKQKNGKLVIVRSAMSLILVLPMVAGSAGQGSVMRTDRYALVQSALVNEARAATDTQHHPMRYRLRKTSPRLTSTKEIFETRDGAVARLVAINDSPLSPADEQKEQDRLDLLLSDPGRQRHRKQAEEEDTARAMKVLRALPFAFMYQYKGPGETPSGKVEKFTFTPNPKFSPADLETQALTHMTGEIWIDPSEQRVVHLEGHLTHDVDFGWGILGRLYEGGWIVIEQARVGENQWRIVHFQMSISARVLFKAKLFETTEDESRYALVPVGLKYQQAIRMLRAEDVNASKGVEASAKR